MLDKIKQLRDETGASIHEIRKALEVAGGDMNDARGALREQLGVLAAKRAEREVHAGVVDAYVHANSRIGTLVELQCETDFVARNPEFKRLAHDIAMHIAAMAPANADELLEQEYIREPDRRVGDLIREVSGTFGEHIQVGNFVRFEL